MRRPLNRRVFLAGSLLGASGLASTGGCNGREQRTRMPVASGARVLDFWMWESRRNWRQVARRANLQRAFPHLDLEFLSLDRGQVRSKLLISLAAGVGLPDISRCDLAWYRSIIEAGGALDLTHRVASARQELIPAVYDSLTINGRIYAIPQDILAYQMGYRVDIFRKAGLPTDPDEVSRLWSTYDDYLSVGRELKRRTGAFLFNIDPTESYWNYDVVQLAGSSGQFDKDLNVIFDSDYHIAAAVIWKRLFNSGVVSSYSYNSPQYWESVKADAQATRIWGGVDDYRTRDFAPAQLGLWRIAKLPRVTPESSRISGGPTTVLIVPGKLPGARRDLAVDVAAFLGLEKAATVAYSRVFAGTVSAHLPCLVELKTDPSPALDRQSTIGWILNTLETDRMWPWYRSSVHFPLALRAQKDAVFRILTADASIAKTLKEAADQVRKMQRITGIS